MSGHVAWLNKPSEAWKQRTVRLTADTLTTRLVSALRALPPRSRLAPDGALPLTSAAQGGAYRRLLRGEHHVGASAAARPAQAAVQASDCLASRSRRNTTETSDDRRHQPTGHRSWKLAAAQGGAVVQPADQIEQLGGACGRRDGRPPHAPRQADGAAIPPRRPRAHRHARPCA